LNPPHPWTDSYIIAVASEMLPNYRFTWSRLEKVDPGLSLEEIDGLLKEIRRAGCAPDPATPPRLRDGEAVEAQVARLFALIERTRRAVVQAFTGPQAIPDRLWATCRFPRAYLMLPSPALAPAHEVEFIHLGDLPPSTDEWRHRARLVEYPELKSLTLFNMQLGRHSLGIDLAQLRRLQCLDLRENGFEQVPREVLQCPSLRWLDLSDNPLGSLPDLTSLPELAFLGLRRTRVSNSTIAALRRQLPNLTINSTP